MENRIVIIDGNSLMNRAFFAIQTPMVTKDGITTHGVYGFLNMLSKIGKDYPYTHIVVTFDKKAPTFRHEEYADYKAGRKPMPNDLVTQFPILKEVLSAMNISMLEMEGFEADDLIGTISLMAENEGFEPLIITGDKDALQLASEKTHVLITKRGVSNFDLYDDKTMLNEYGLTPMQFIDLKGLMGDKSDNIPGVPGIGPKTGMELIQKYESIENLLNHLDELKGKMKTNLKENTMQALMSKRLATIHRHVPIDAEISDFENKAADMEKLKDLYIKLEFNTFLKRMKENSQKKEVNFKNKSGKNIEDEIQEENEHNFELVRKTREFVELTDEKQIEEAIGQLKAKQEKDDANIYLHVYSDMEHKKMPEVYGIGIMSHDKVLYLSDSKRENVIAVAVAIIKNRLKIKGHFLVDSYYVLLRYIYEDKKLLNELGKQAGYLFETSGDSAIANYVLNPSASKYMLENVYLDTFAKMLKMEELEVYSQMSIFDDKDKYFKALSYMADIYDMLFQKQEKDIEKNELSYVYENIELPLVEVMASMGAYGFKADSGKFKEIGSNISSKIAELTEKIHSLAGEEFNVNSPSQLGVILFEKLGLKAIKKTKTGYSTSADVLEKLKDKHPIIPLVLEYRTLAKINSTYVEGLIPLVGSDGKIHASFQQASAATGRISCTEPNLQNIPIRQELGRSIRKAFHSEDGFILTGADYSQIELRVLAHLSKEPHLIEAFNNGDDIHRITAAKVFHVEEKDVTPLQRSNAKAVNFGVIYGMSGFGLSEELGIDMSTARHYIKHYFETNPNVEKLMNELKEQARQEGFVTTIFGRKRYINELKSSNFMVRQLGERLAMNTPIQGSAADIIKLAMIKVYRKLMQTNVYARLILQIHDELIIEAPKEFQSEACELLRKAMEEATKLDINLEVDIHSSENWYDLK